MMRPIFDFSLTTDYTTFLSVTILSIVSSCISLPKHGIRLTMIYVLSIQIEVESMYFILKSFIKLSQHQQKRIY
jgi:hypothetical protein